MVGKLTMLAIYSILIFFAPVAQADEIYLQDGNVIKVKRCWEKDGHVLFNLEDSGQLYSIKKELVIKIEQTRSASGQPTKTP